MPVPLAGTSCPSDMVAFPASSLSVAGQRPVPVGAFCIDQHEVSTDEYGACVHAGRCSPDYVHERSADGHRFVCDASCNPAGIAGPMSCVDWVQAETYCRAVGKRLPSKEEWSTFARHSSGNAHGDSLADIDHALGRDRWEWTSSIGSSDAWRVLAHVDVREGGWYELEGTQGRYDTNTTRSPSFRANFLGFRCAR
jgi:formylglycine-generating enzyme required for sulfatase activity